MVRDGYIYGLSLLAVAVVLGWATGSWVWSIAPVLLAAFFLWFFRDRIGASLQARAWWFRQAMAW